MSERFIMIETTTRQQIAERLHAASTQRLARGLPGEHRHRLGRALRRRGDRPEN